MMSWIIKISPERLPQALLTLLREIEGPWFSWRERPEGVALDLACLEPGAGIVSWQPIMRSPHWNSADESWPGAIGLGRLFGLRGELLCRRERDRFRARLIVDDESTLRSLGDLGADSAIRLTPYQETTRREGESLFLWGGLKIGSESLPGATDAARLTVGIWDEKRFPKNFCYPEQEECSPGPISVAGPSLGQAPSLSLPVVSVRRYSAPGATDGAQLRQPLTRWLGMGVRAVEPHPTK
jgi:hypothetical protein